MYNSGTYRFSDYTWTTAAYTVDSGEGGESGKKFAQGATLTDGAGTYDGTTLILIPQTLPAGAKIVLTCTDKTYTAAIGGKTWVPGKLVTYTLYENKAPDMIYFDLAAGNVTITETTYKGYRYSVDEKGQSEIVGVPETGVGTHVSGAHYYVYQSTDENWNAIWEKGVCTPPTYGEVEGPDGRPWREFITNNTDVESVITSWNVAHETLVTAAERSGTKNRIAIDGNVTCDLTIDNIYSSYQDPNPTARTTAGISFSPSPAGENAKLTINMLGDNRLGTVHYFSEKGKGNQIIFEGTGSLTVADVDGVVKGLSDDEYCGLASGEGKGYWSNHWSTAIGGTDDNKHEQSDGIVINSGTIFAGTTKAENCTAIGGGGNEYGTVTINGGTVTAVATTTGTAIGGGIGYGSPGGMGVVTITGGNVYAYNHVNIWGIPSSAIGGAGSRKKGGALGIVKISGGYVYAESALGTAIGGGSSSWVGGGDAEIEITGGEVIAKTESKISASIGGGTGFVNDDKKRDPELGAYNGGSATITISGNPIIRTGSIGGGGTGDTGGTNPGYLGNATIKVSGGDIQAQFILAAGSRGTPSFTMDGGTIRNSDTLDEVYKHVKENGGAVYLENGKVEISAGEIRNCSAERGGAIYITGKQGDPSSASFTMTGGKIRSNGVAEDGGAIYIIDGTVELSGGTIEDNVATIGDGGGIFIQRGNLTVDGATIQNNSAEAAEMRGGKGGGIYVYSYLEDVNVKLVSGVITENTADRRGGGVCVDLQKKRQGSRCNHRNRRRTKRRSRKHPNYRESCFGQGRRIVCPRCKCPYYHQ